MVCQSRPTPAPMPMPGRHCTSQWGHPYPTPHRPLPKAARLYHLGSKNKTIKSCGLCSPSSHHCHHRRIRAIQCRTLRLHECTYLRDRHRIRHEKCKHGAKICRIVCTIVGCKETFATNQLRIRHETTSSRNPWRGGPRCIICWLGSPSTGQTE
jgi:hypothetical protein